MKMHIYHFLHVASMFLLIGFVFQAFANPDPKKKMGIMMGTGMLALLALIGGFGLLGVMKIGFPIWVIIKLVCWLVIASIAGIAYRKPEKIPALTAITIVCILLAVISVYLRFGEPGFE